MGGRGGLTLAGVHVKMGGKQVGLWLEETLAIWNCTQSLAPRVGGTSRDREPGCISICHNTTATIRRCFVSTQSRSFVDATRALNNFKIPAIPSRMPPARASWSLLLALELFSDVTPAPGIWKYNTFRRSAPGLGASFQALL